MIKFVGLPQVQDQIKLAIAAAQSNHHTVPVKHFLLRLDEGEGRTTLLRYMSELYARYEVRQFLDMDPFLEEIIPDNYTELLQMIARINSHAVYTNHYTGIIGCDVTNMAKHMNDVQYMNSIQDLIRSLSETALFVFFFPAAVRKQDDQIVELLNEWCDQFTVGLSTECYTNDSLMQILMLLLEQQHIYMDKNETNARLTEIFAEKGPPKTPADVKRVVKIIHHAITYSATTLNVPQPNKAS